VENHMLFTAERDCIPQIPLAASFPVIYS